MNFFHILIYKDSGGYHYDPRKTDDIAYQIKQSYRIG